MTTAMTLADAIRTLGELQARANAAEAREALLRAEVLAWRAAFPATAGWCRPRTSRLAQAIDAVNVARILTAEQVTQVT